MTDEQWRAAWVLSEMAGDLDADSRREFLKGVTADLAVEHEVLELFDELGSEADTPPALDRRVGDVVGRYVLLERIGQGGMGEVYSAEDRELKRLVALKFLPATVFNEDHFAAQVISEARLASRLNHPNIVIVHELIDTRWGLAIAMELVEGQSLRSVLRNGILPRRRIISLGRQLAGALAAAHDRGIVHRDIKPENIMLREDGFAKLLDFGLARRPAGRGISPTDVTLPAGTFRYMSPEQRAGRPASAASDIYSLALVLEEAGSWRHPILSRMRSANPDGRARAKEVEAVLAGLESSSRWGLVAGAAFCLLLLISGLTLRVKRENPQPPEPPVQITHYSTGHGLTVASLSPAGERVAYSTFDGGFFVRELSTGKVLELAGPERFHCYQLFFAGSEQLLAIGYRDPLFEAWQIPLNRHSPARLSADVQFAAVSHSGKRIAWVDGNHRIWVGDAPGSAAKLLLEVSGAHVANLFWSGDDKEVWYRRVSECHGDAGKPDAVVAPSGCLNSELVSASSTRPHAVQSLYFNSGFFTHSGDFLFLRQDRKYWDEGYNIWRLSVDPVTRQFSSSPVQVTHFRSAPFYCLSGTPDGKRLTAVRSEFSTQTYVAEWVDKPAPAVSALRLLTVEDRQTFPHAWSADNQWVIFESDKTGNLEIYRQNISRLAPERLTSSSRENYMAQLTPDGKSILFMSSKASPHGNTDLQLMRIPVGGGVMLRVPVKGDWDEFRCGRVGESHECVLRQTLGPEQIYYELDPFSGKGNELGRTTTRAHLFGGWALSPDAKSVAVPDWQHPGSFLEMNLDPDSSKRHQSLRRVAGLTRIDGISPGPANGQWLLSAFSKDEPLNQMNMPPYFIDEHGTSQRYLVDRQLHVRLLETLPGYAVFSNDHKHLATVKPERTTNVWSLAP